MPSTPGMPRERKCQVSRWQVPALAVLAATATACGFHLQGAAALPPSMSMTYLRAPDADSALARRLRPALTAAGAGLASTPADATAVLAILSDEAGERVLSVSATGVPEEFELYHTVRFELSSNGTQLLEPSTMTVTRDYRFDPTDVLGKRQEAVFLEEAMVEDLVRLMLRRLAFLQRSREGP